MFKDVIDIYKDESEKFINSCKKKEINNLIKAYTKNLGIKIKFKLNVHNKESIFLEDYKKYICELNHIHIRSLDKEEAMILYSNDILKEFNRVREWIDFYLYNILIFKEEEIKNRFFYRKSPLKMKDKSNIFVKRILEKDLPYLENNKFFIKGGNGIYEN